MSDDDDSGTLVHGPWGGDDSYAPPPIPSYADTIPPPPDTPPEPPDGTAITLPPIPDFPDPVTALRSDGFPSPEPDDEEYEDEEYEDGEYQQPRSLADRLGDWLEYRIDRARARNESEAPFREAEIARKVALLGSRTARETALMEQNGKLHQAMMKARGDRASARGKADADRMRSGGIGTDKGRSKTGAGGGRGGSGPGSTRPGGSGPGGRNHNSKPLSAGRNSPKGSDKAPSGGRTGPGAHNGAAGGPKGLRAGADNRNKSPRGKDTPGKVIDPHKPGNRPWKGRGNAKPSAGISPWKDKPQNKPAPKNGKAGTPDTKNGSANAARRGRLPAGTALDPHKPGNRPWKDRPKTGETNGKANGPASGASTKPGADSKNAKDAPSSRPKVNLRKDKDTPAGTSGSRLKVNLRKDRDTSGGGSGGRKSAPAPEEPEPTEKGAHRPSGTSGKGIPGTEGTGGTAGGSSGRATGERLKDRWRKARERTAAPGEPAGPVPAESVGITVERADTPDGMPAGRRPISSPPGVTTGTKSLPRASEPHMKRPGTTRPTSKENNHVSNTEVTTPSAHGGLATQHRTDITFDEYLVEMVNIAINAGLDKDRAEALAQALGTVADALRDMAADLIGDHNIATAVTDLITDLADAAGRMKIQAERCAAECDIASEAARLAAASVGRVYGQDMDAKDDAGLSYASSAAHHD